MQNDAISRRAVLEMTSTVAAHGAKFEVIFPDDVEQLPALDVAPVVHARWIPIKLYGEDHAIKCSACNNCDNPSKVPGRYCWQCGAKMDAKEENQHV